MSDTTWSFAECTHGGAGVKHRTYEKHLQLYTGESKLLWFVHMSSSCQDFTAAIAVGWADHFTLWNSLCATCKDQKYNDTVSIKKTRTTCFLHFWTLTQWSRACRKSNSSSVQSSSVLDLELTRASHSSRRSFVCTQCSDSSHFVLIVSRGSCQTKHMWHIPENGEIVPVCQPKSTKNMSWLQS